MSFQPIDDDTLLDYADGALEPQRRAEVEALLGDPGLRAEVEGLRRLQGDLRATFAAADRLPMPGPATWARIARRVERRGQRWLNLALGGAATALIVIAFAALLGQSSPRGTLAAPTAPPRPPMPAIPTGTLPSGRIAFAALHGTAGAGCASLGVYTLDSGTSQPSYLAQGCTPLLSPNGALLAYRREGHIFVIPAGGGPEINVSGPGLIDNRTLPSWSPDSQRLAFTTGWNNRSEFYLVDADGSNLTRITLGSAGWANGRAGIDLLWSPDGKRLAFTLSQNENWDIYTIGIDGDQLTRLTDARARDSLIGWSPDGRKLLFWSERDGGTMGIYVMNADGSGQTQLVGSDFAGWASWSPDGTQIAFASGRDGQLYVMNADGGEPRRLTNLPIHVVNQVWSRDGQSIIFGAFSADWKEGALYTIRTDGSQLTRLNSADLWLQWVQR